MKYFEELKKSMNYLAKDERTIFLGQAVKAPGTAMSNTFKGINSNKLIELPVAEEMQMGMSNGLAINGLIPVSIFPRWNFLLLAMNQLINHLDKIKLMSNDSYKTKVIVRTGIVSERPFAIASIAGRISIANTINKTPPRNPLSIDDLIVPT